MTAVIEPAQIAAPEPESPPRAAVGVGLLALGVAVAELGHLLVPQLGVLTWAIGLGVAATNLRILPAAAVPGLGALTKRLLRVGVVLLGFSVSFASIAALGLPMVALVAGVLVSTLLFTLWLGRRVGVGGPRSLLIATGVAVCGASAIAAMEETADADEDDVAAAIGMVTLFGTLALIAIPLAQGPLGLTDLQVGAWAGASVHEVGQVVAAAGSAGAAAVSIAVVVKLTRVVLLAPVVAVVGIVRRRSAPTTVVREGRPPLVPLFVLGFLACAALRTIGVVPDAALGWIGQVQVVALGAALFGMGCSVRISDLLRNGRAVIVMATLATLFISGLSLAGLLLITPGS